MRINDELTHVVLCSNTLRSPINARLTELAAFIPTGFLGVDIEYDKTGVSPDNTISGYRYSDLLTTCIYLAPTNEHLNAAMIAHYLDKGPTELGLKILEKVSSNLHDKYQLKKSIVDVEELVVFPGSNVLAGDSMNWPLIDSVVKNGAKIKPHPITTKMDLFLLTEKYGESILNKDLLLYPLINKAKKIYFPLNSEAGLAAVMLGKETALINSISETDYLVSYKPIYQALDTCKLKASMVNKIAALFSYPETGLFSIFHLSEVDVEQWVNAFFFRYQNYLHGKSLLQNAAAALGKSA